MMEYERYITIVFLSAFALVGTVGNILVLYGFTRCRQKFTSSLFILTLAGIDLITCVITIPSNIAMEVLNFNVPYDIICKLYHFLVSTTIPFSAFIMVAIAVDRYFCICKPFAKVMTHYRVGIIVASLCITSICLGMLSCLNYGIYKNPDNLYENLIDRNMSNIGLNQAMEAQLMELLKELSTHDKNDLLTEPINTFKCQESAMLLGDEFFSIFQKIYSSFYGLSCVFVIVIYSVIYRFILKRRQRRLRMESFPCCTFRVPHNGDSENTEVMYLSQDASVVVEERDKNHNAESQRQLVRSESSERKKDKFSLGHEKQERIRRNNIKTAIMLSLVAFVFIVAFLPAWLMKLRLVGMNVVVFNMYFIYNVINPFIYAFMNPDFQNQLKEVFLNLCR
ncbi:orexin receptor type 2-like [Mizuhopecten yessoensis]|uniref:Cholecystokinin receptor type A n=1 Tax=Mizuhopecten yessoensis TaxID=6573 RepID=A0A210Q3T7_MIZYE|nr:orexin receptor type 2-like [Mizuhopecten yessoensis]OWF43406.1 Cholecystokinin receptor type A [Mizuhopecten yessoensis]